MSMQNKCPLNSCLKRFLSIGAALAILLIIGFALKTNTPSSSSPADLILQPNGQVSDKIVELLGWTGVRIANDPLPVNPHWPEARITLQSRTLEEISPVTNGNVNPSFSWRQMPKQDKRQLERWEMDMRMDTTPLQVKAIIALIKNDLELQKEISPKEKSYTGTLFLSAWLPSIRLRLAFLNKIIDEKKTQIGPVYILIGERPLAQTAGESEEDLVNLNNGIISFNPRWVPPQQLPTDEGDMAKLVFNQSRHPTLKDEDIKVVYTPKKAGEPRATTESTLFQWLKEVNPPAGTYLVISNQPYVLYQELVILRCLLEANRPDIRIETVGPQLSDHLGSSRSESQEAAVLLDNVNRLLYELTKIQKLKRR